MCWHVRAPCWIVRHRVSATWMPRPGGVVIRTTDCVDCSCLAGHCLNQLLCLAPDGEPQASGRRRCLPFSLARVPEAAGLPAWRVSFPIALFTSAHIRKPRSPHMKSPPDPPPPRAQESHAGQPAPSRRSGTFRRRSPVIPPLVAEVEVVDRNSGRLTCRPGRRGQSRLGGLQRCDPGERHHRRGPLNSACPCRRRCLADASRRHRSQGAALEVVPRV